MTNEAWITVIRTDGVARSAVRHPLTVPVELATGQLEKLSDLALREALKDLEAETARRSEVAATRAAIQQRTGGWSPFDALKGAA